jgi:hypothetical protein
MRMPCQVVLGTGRLIVEILVKKIKYVSTFSHDRGSVMRVVLALVS